MAGHFVENHLLYNCFFGGPDLSDRTFVTPFTYTQNIKYVVVVIQGRIMHDNLPIKFYGSNVRLFEIQLHIGCWSPSNIRVVLFQDPTTTEF